MEQQEKLPSFEEILEKIKLEIQKLQDENRQKSYELIVHKNFLKDFVHKTQALKNEERFDFEDVVYSFERSALLLLNKN